MTSSSVSSVSLPPPQDSFLFSVSIISGLTCIILAVVKFMLGKVLTSRALVTDGASHTHSKKRVRALEKDWRMCVGRGGVLSTELLADM